MEFVVLSLAENQTFVLTIDLDLKRCIFLKVLTL